MTRLTEKPTTPIAERASSDDYLKAFQRIATSSVDAAFASLERSFKRPTPLAYDPTTIARAYSDFFSAALTSPTKLFQAQKTAVKTWIDFNRHVADQVFGGKGFLDVQTARSDRRFSNKGWNTDLYFKTIKEAYLLASGQMLELANEIGNIDDAARTRLDFVIRQHIDALSPSNFALTNPEVVKKTLETGGLNLLGGLANLLADYANPEAWVQRNASQTFNLGEDIAATAGEVVFQNDIMQLIQYNPTTDSVFKRPMLYVPPLVNKYYLMDLKPSSSLFKWLVDQGHTVFTISWINPNKQHRDFDFDTYVLDGVTAALDAVEAATGEKKVDLFAFCMGGAIAAGALGHLANIGESSRVATATLFATLIDNSALGEWGTFTTNNQVSAFNRHIAERGIITGSDLKKLFSVVRSNDLIWNSVIDQYLLDRKAPPSDLMQWFADGSNIPAKFLKTWSEDVLAGNKLTARGGVRVSGKGIDLSKVKTPIFNLGLKDDHVAGWKSVFASNDVFGGPITFVLGGSGHNAGIVNPPAREKHGFWINNARKHSAEDWLETAEQHQGSWWPLWQKWLTSGKQKQVKLEARQPGDQGLSILEAAPGSYVRS